MSHTMKPRAQQNIVKMIFFFFMHKILFAGTIIFSGCSRFKLNLGKELNITSSLPPVLLNIL